MTKKKSKPPQKLPKCLEYTIRLDWPDGTDEGWGLFQLLLKNEVAAMWEEGRLVHIAKRAGLVKGVKILTKEEMKETDAPFPPEEGYEPETT